MPSSASASPKRAFINYPLPKECPNTVYNHEVDKNPPLRGYSLAVASTLVERFPSLQTYFWSTAGFGTVKDIRYLDEAHARSLQGAVIPLPAEGDAATAQSVGELTSPAAYPAQSAPRYHSAADYHAMYKSGAATPLQAAMALLPYITGDKGAEHATAWTACKRDEVLAEARASTERWAAGKPIGVLDGVPFGVKCDTPVAGYVNTFGIKPQAGLSFFKKVQEEDCWPVKKMREAGAVMVGRLNMHEVGMDTTGCNPGIGTPTNWFNKSYYPGGSSSGGGSVVGVGLIPISIGTDAGGSVRIPAAFNGCFGLKVTHDRTMAMNSLMCVTGPLGATTADLRAAYRVMAQPNPDCEVQGRFAPTSCPPTADANTTRPKLLGICKAWVELAKPEVRACFDAAVAHMVEKQGYTVVDIELPYLREGQVGHAAACLTEGVDHQRMRHDPAAGDGGGWVDMLSYPSRVLLSIGQHTRSVDYVKIMQLRQLLMRHLAHLYSEKHPGMLIVSPLSAIPGWRKHPADARFGVSDGNVTFENMRYIWLSNMTGCPSVSAPMGYVEPKVGEGRVPVGIIAMGEWGEEESLLDWAADVEGYLNGMEGGRPRPKEWVDVIKLAKETESEELVHDDVKAGKQRQQKL
ncbi:hypothetical protein MCOR27_006375 [Pyricularia oryzae]|uniref:Amidase domain-containing protein n=2 Tax=Pyricularia TaxID=48558 RepID=A0ABQ8NNL1_PYRGI|nr:hypothetical protein MCOR01_010648 [Pyricularia oryzae]KAI6299616.1 hypothetical protein MCOR33_004523 [Pyricularia grisea]KAH9438336.1 hypothetical protein MCOR02_001971 [Pyricularia oryzae]KAI6257776.1 hypothetical protein MCOR19_005795 [Pyricularia oryzae]KAI6269434.1 hypothetical protein MCOR26_008714 [Pyricularia oryzae]